ncbi:MAG: transcription antitermination factor NusB [Pyrinomonadaceae bacterium]
MKKISPARIAAFEILRRVKTEKAFSSVLLPAFEENLLPPDRRLCHQLTLGVLRNLIYLDRVIEKFTKKRISKFDPEVLIALRLGLFQLLFLERIPAYSAINESVNLVHRAKKKSATGLVNAVLRRVSKEGTLIFDYSDEVERISVETSHPRWLLENWAGQFGFEKAAEIARANNRTPETVFRLTARFYRRSEKERREIWNELEKRELKRSEYLDDCFIISGVDENLRKLAESGDVYFQEEGSQMVGKAVGLMAGQNFLDVCAAPGSKTTFLAKELERSGRRGPNGENRMTKTGSEAKGFGTIVAGDLYLKRAGFLRENCRKQGAENVRVLVYDAEENLPFADQSFDVVLVDAPCSGTGTIGQNPEIRYFLKKEDFPELSGKQLKILLNASKLVKRGGRLIYSTCSLEKAENEEVAGKFLSLADGFQKSLKGMPDEFITQDGFARTDPDRDRMDGFFIAGFEKN